MPLHRDERLEMHVRYSCDDFVDVLSRKAAGSKVRKRSDRRRSTKAVKGGIAMEMRVGELNL